MKEKLAGSLIGNGAEVGATWRGLSRPDQLRIGGSMAWVLLITLAFVQPLTRLMWHAAQSELHSYILLVPFVAGYLLYLKRKLSSGSV